MNKQEVIKLLKIAALQNKIEKLASMRGFMSSGDTGGMQLPTKDKPVKTDRQVAREAARLAARQAKPTSSGPISRPIITPPQQAFAELPPPAVAATATPKPTIDIPKLTVATPKPTIATQLGSKAKHVLPNILKALKFLNKNKLPVAAGAIGGLGISDLVNLLSSGKKQTNV